MKQIAVVGLGRFGSNLAVELQKLGYAVLAIDKDDKLVNTIADSVSNALVADATDKDALVDIGIQSFENVVVAIGASLEASILVTLVLKELGIPNIIAKARDEYHTKILERLGATRVISPEHDMGIRLARSIATPNLLDYIEISQGYSIAEIDVQQNISGKTLMELDWRRKYGINVVAIKHKNGALKLVPRADDKILEGDIIVVVGENSKIERMKDR